MEIVAAMRRIRASSFTVSNFKLFRFSIQVECGDLIHSLLIHFKIVRVQVQGYEEEESVIRNISRWRQGISVQAQTQGEQVYADNLYLIAEWNELSIP